MRFLGDGDDIDFCASHVLYDSFYELVTALQAVLEFGNAHDVHIYEEPDESILTVEKTDQDLVLTWAGEKTRQVKMGFQGGCREIALNMHRILTELGDGEFEREWHHPPPRDRLELLWARLGIE